MNRGRLESTLRIAGAASAILALGVTGWLAWRRPEHVAAWLALLSLCGP